MEKVKTIVLQVVTGLIPVLYFLSVWDQLPGQVPTHYNIKFEADAFGSKSEMLGIVLFVFAISLTASILLNNINKFDPKRRYDTSGNLMLKISWTFTIFFMLMSSLVIYQTTKYQPGTNSDAPKYLFALLGLFFAALGNLINNVKPNYFVGIRTPWTLDNEDNWRRTHHMGSKLFFFGGLLMAILVLLLPAEFGARAFMFTIIPMVLIPIAYSFWIFRQKKNGIS